MEFDSGSRLRCAGSKVTRFTLPARVFTSENLRNDPESPENRLIQGVEIRQYELRALHPPPPDRKCQFLHRVRYEFRRLPLSWPRQQTCHGNQRLSEKTYQKDAIDAVIGPCPDGPDADIGFHRREQLLHAVLVPVHPPDRTRVQVQIRREAEEPLASVYGPLEDIVAGLLFSHTRELRLKIYVRFYQVVADPIPLFQSLPVIQVLLEADRLPVQLIGLLHSGGHVQIVQLLAVEVVVHTGWEPLLQAVLPLVRVNAFPRVLGERSEQLIIGSVQLLPGQEVVPIVDDGIQHILAVSPRIEYHSRILPKIALHLPV